MKSFITIVAVLGLMALVLKWYGESGSAISRASGPTERPAETERPQQSAAIAAPGPGRIAGEREGTVKFEDCREQIVIPEPGGPLHNINTFQNDPFICWYTKTNSGRVMSGMCTAVEMEEHTCKRSYTYYKKAELTCYAHSALGVDDNCHPDPGYRWVPEKKAMEEMSCPKHSFLLKADYTCWPDSGFHWPAETGHFTGGVPLQEAVTYELQGLPPLPPGAIDYGALAEQARKGSVGEK